MYIPKHAFSMDKVEMQQVRLGIQGPPGEGKTWAALTFPNPLVVNYNQGLGAHIGRTDVNQLPFWDVNFIRKIYNGSDNKRDALPYWILTEGVKLEANQTLVIDKLTDLQDAHEIWEAKNPTFSKSGKIDDFAAWAHKVAFFGELTSSLKSLKCHVVMTADETRDRDKEGELNGKTRPLLTGQFGDRIAGDFTDWFRQLAVEKLPSDKVDDKVLAKFKMTKKEFIDWQDTYPRNTVYVWKTESDNVFSGKCSSLINFPTFLPADFNSFKKYMRNNLSGNNAAQG